MFSSRTDSNAIAGPSNYRTSVPTTLSATAFAPPRPVASPLVEPKAEESHAGVEGPTAQVVPPVVVRSVTGPTIVPTILCADGVKEVPSLFELCQVDDLITLISSMLERLIAHNDRIPLTPTSLTRFHSRAPPSINVPDYLLRIARYTNVESAVLLSLLPYVDKVCARMPTFTVSSLTVHRFVIAGVSVGSKALSDSFCTNGRYARVGGVSMTEMNLLEKEFCEAIDWRLTTTGSVLAHYYTSLVRSHPLYRLAPPPPTSPVVSTSPPHASSSAMDLDVEPTSRLSALKSDPFPSSTSPDDPPSKASPALIPARMNGGRRFVTASNLPSPVRGVSSVPSSSVDLGEISISSTSSRRASRESSVSTGSSRDHGNVGDGGVRASPLGQEMEVRVEGEGEGREGGRGIEGKV